MKRIVFILVIAMLTGMFASCGNTTSLPKEQPEGFSFSLTWGCYGVSSYDSETGKLVKTTDATHPEDYITTCQLSEDELAQIYELIRDLDIESYPDDYNPHPNGLATIPSETLILSVHTDTLDKTVTAEDVSLTYESSSPKGRKFLATCKTISDILVSTDEWKALPEYEFLYD